MVRSFGCSQWRAPLRRPSATLDVELYHGHGRLFGIRRGNHPCGVHMFACCGADACSGRGCRSVYEKNIVVRSAAFLPSFTF
eukprot:861623-Prymnesium_polylepis.2